jgi:hypothetical protein
MSFAVAAIAAPVLAALAALHMSSKTENKSRDFFTIVIIATLMAAGSW